MSRYEILLNPAARDAVPPAGFGPVTRLPERTHRSLPGYAPTRLRSCPALAERLGVGDVLVKDEAERLGLPSFKILGASWATLTTVVDAWGLDVAAPLTLAGVRDALGHPAGRGLVAATDGNHGRGVARMAALLGLEATVLVPAGTARARIDAIASEGARVEVVEGTYDDAIAASARMADADHLVVSDTSWNGYERTPRAVVEGYSTMFLEVDDELAEHGIRPPDVVALQAGVGAFAAAGLRHYRGAPGSSVRTVVVEPLTAACLMASARAGALTMVPGPHTSTMAGLNCGLPSELVWPIVAAGADVFLGIRDEATEEAMRALAREGIVAGESGAAGLAGLLVLAEHGTPTERGWAGLRPDASVLVVNTEGATDPDHYEAVVGHPDTAVAATAGSSRLGRQHQHHI